MFRTNQTKPTGRIDTLVGAGSRIDGDIHFVGGLRIDGSVKGSVIADDAGTDWLYEAVWHEREWVVVRQLGAAEDGTITRYWWQRLEDDEGMLTDQALDRDEWGLRPLSREDFYTAWDDPGWSLTA